MNDLVSLEYSLAALCDDCDKAAQRAGRLNGPLDATAALLRAARATLRQGHAALADHIERRQAALPQANGRVRR
jgi:hypothetical protein